MGFFLFVNIWRLVINNFGLCNEHEELGLKKKGKLQKRDAAQTLALFMFSLIGRFLIARKILIKTI
jgi:hypothetical protein